jgi:hypothetical protein
MPEKRLDAEVQQALIPMKEESVAVVRAPSNQLLDFIQSAITDPRADVAKMTQAVDLYERLLRHDAETAFNQAMARLAPKLPRVQKNGTIDMGAKGQIPFAKYEDVDRMIRPLLIDEGFTLSFAGEPSTKGVTITCRLMHTLGHSVTSTMELPPDQGPGRNQLQALGSSRSYAKRYLVLDILNIITVGEDDDGASVGVLTDQELSTVRNMMAECELTDQETEGFLKVMHVESEEKILHRDYGKALNNLKMKLATPGVQKRKGR